MSGISGPPRKSPSPKRARRPGPYDRPSSRTDGSNDASMPPPPPPVRRRRSSDMSQPQSATSTGSNSPERRFGSLPLSGPASSKGPNSVLSGPSSRSVSHEDIRGRQSRGRPHASRTAAPRSALSSKSSGRRPPRSAAEASGPSVPRQPLGDRSDSYPYEQPSPSASTSLSSKRFQPLAAVVKILNEVYDGKRCVLTSDIGPLMTIEYAHVFSARHRSGDKIPHLLDRDLLPEREDSRGDPKIQKSDREPDYITAWRESELNLVPILNLWHDPYDKGRCFAFFPVRRALWHIIMFELSWIKYRLQQINTGLPDPGRPKFYLHIPDRDPKKRGRDPIWKYEVHRTSKRLQVDRPLDRWDVHPANPGRQIVNRFQWGQCPGPDSDGISFPLLDLIISLPIAVHEAVDCFQICHANDGAETVLTPYQMDSELLGRCLIYLWDWDYEVGNGPPPCSLVAAPVDGEPVFDGLEPHGERFCRLRDDVTKTPSTEDLAEIREWVQQTQGERKRKAEQLAEASRVRRAQSETLYEEIYRELKRRKSVTSTPPTSHSTQHNSPPQVSKKPRRHSVSSIERGAMSAVHAVTLAEKAPHVPTWGPERVQKLIRIERWRRAVTDGDSEEASL